MQKNVASQVIGAQLVSATDGSAFTGSVTCYVTGDGGTQAAGSVGSGACTHEGNGYHTYTPAQAETNYDLIAFTFTGTGAVPVTVQVFTSLDVRTKTGFALSASGLASVTAWTVDVTGSLSGSVGSVTGNVGGIAGTTQTLDALQTSLNSAHGSGSWATATGFSTHSAADVWAVATRVLTAGTNISLAKGTGITGFNDLSAAQVNAEVDTALADYDGPTNTEMVAAFTEIKGSTWATTDTLEAIRDRGDAAWTTATGFSTITAANVRDEVERMAGVRDWGVYGDAPLFEPAVSDNSMATWGTPVYDGTTRRLYYTAGNGSGSYVIRHIALDADGLPTGSPTTVLSGSEAYDTAGVFLPVVERESTTLHMFYCGMPSAFTNQNICYATASTSDPLTWTKQGVAIAYSDLPAYLHSGAEPTGLIKFGSTYYMYLCSTHGGAAAALGASTMDRRAAVATSSSLAGPWTITPLLCESTAESYQEPWIYQISPSVFRASSASTALFYMISASGGVNTDYQQLELHESPTPLFSREYTRHIGTVLVPRDEGGGFPDWEIDVVGTLTDDIEKDTFTCTSSGLWLYFGGKSHSDGLWKMGLSKQTSVVKALRPPIQTRCHRYGTQLPLRAANVIEERDAAIVADTNELQTDWANGGRLDTILDTSAALFTTALSESYRAADAVGTPSQILQEILQGMSDFVISGTTKTVRRRDSTTTAKTYTLNDGTTPTGITEAT